MLSPPLTEVTTTWQEEDHNLVRQDLRATFEVLLTVGVAFFILIIFSFALRATEVFVESKLVIREAAAATREKNTYEAKLLLRTAEKLTLVPDEVTTYRIGFKNLGSANWRSSGKNFLSLYSRDPNYRKSIFESSSWYRPEQPALLKDLNVPPGGVGYFEFELQAPREVGIFRETFGLAAEDRTWIEGGKFTIEIKVEKLAARQPTLVVQEAAPVRPIDQETSEGYGANLLLRSFRGEIQTDPGAAVEITLGFKNTGRQVWQTQTLRSTGFALAAAASGVRHISWLSPDEVTRVSQPVRPGEIGFFRFTLQAPNKKGTYSPRFSLQADGVVVPGSEIDIPLTVTADGPESALPALLPAVVKITEPRLRVGLYPTRGAVALMANGDYTIFDGQGARETVPGGQPARVLYDFDYKTFSVTTPTGTQVLRDFIRFVPARSDGFFTLTSYLHPPDWNPSLNDNQFRDTIEIRQAPESGRLWVINELLIEQYLYGLTETSNNTHPEFQKSLALAARTYAFYHWRRNSKHGGVFHIDAFYDQVYRGLMSEKRMLSFVAATDATRGVIAIYNNNEVALTPYYSRSDGRTRAWEEVWGGGPIPWLRSVPTPYDAGKTLWGHGVGMSARDALLRAEAGADWQTILKHYYSGVDLVQKW